MGDNAKPSSSSHPLKSNAKAFIAFSSLLAALFCTAYLCVAQSPHEVNAFYDCVSRAALFLSSAASFAVISKRHESRNLFHLKSILAGSGCLLCADGIITIMGFALNQNASTPWLNTLAYALWGLGFSILLGAVIEFASCLKEDSLQSFLLLALLVAGCIALVVSCFNEIVATTILLALQITTTIGCISLAAESENEPRQSSIPIVKQRLNVGGSFILLIDGMLIGLVASYVFELVSVGLLPSLLQGFCFLAAAILFLCLCRIDILLSLRNRVQLVLLPFIFILVVGMNLSSEPACYYEACLLLAVLLVLDFANLIILIRHGNRISPNSIIGFSGGRVFITLGEGLGWLAGAFVVSQLIDITLLQISFFLFLLICVHISVALLKPNSFPLLPLNNQIPNQAGSACLNGIDSAGSESSTTLEAPEIDEKASIRRSRCQRVAQLNHLTPREEEVLYHLSKGRSVRYISDELVISEQTAKTHANHIYRKLDTHSRQELIDIVDGTSVPEALHD